jgi:uncharacterized protein
MLYSADDPAVATDAVAPLPYPRHRPEQRYDSIIRFRAETAAPMRALVVAGEPLHPFTLETKALFEAFLAPYAVVLADYTFANNFMWLSRMSAFYRLIEDCFCLFALDGGRLTMLLPPLGAPDRQARALATCFDLMEAYAPGEAAVEYAYEGFLALLHDGSRGGAARWRVAQGLPDYLYRTADLIELRGNAYKTKRSEINQFLRSHPEARLEPLGPQHHADIRALVSRWLKHRLCYLDADALTEFFRTAELERLAIERILQHYERLELEGLCLTVDGRLEGFTIGERITADVASVLLEKTGPAVPGAAQYLFRAFAGVFADCTYINAGDDLGLENLRRTKMSYRPVRFEHRFTLRKAPSGELAGMTAETCIGRGREEG